MSFTSTPVAGGTTGALADGAPAIDRITNRDYQRVKLVNPTEDSTALIGVDSAPMTVKNLRRGSSNYDSGLVSVTNGAPASVTAATIFPEGGTASNTSDAERRLTLTDAADNAIMELTLAPNHAIPIPVPSGGSWAGLKAGANGTGVVLQVAGAQ